jgi:hypothetical protein
VNNQYGIWVNKISSFKALYVTPWRRTEGERCVDDDDETVIASPVPVVYYSDVPDFILFTKDGEAIIYPKRLIGFLAEIEYEYEYLE